MEYIGDQCTIVRHKGKMLHRVRIRNFRSCDDTVIEKIERLVALIGHNGAGKSNILLAISLASGWGTSASQINAISFVPMIPGKPFTVELDFECEKNQYRYVFQFGIIQPHPRPWCDETLFRLIDGNPEEFIFRSGPDVKIRDREERIQIGDYAPCLPALTTLLPATEPVVSELKSILGFLSTVRYYPIDEPAMRIGAGQPLMAVQYNSWLTTFESTGNPGDTVLARLVYMSQQRKDDFEILKSWLGKGKLGLIDDIQVTPYDQTIATSTGAAPTTQTQFYIIHFFPSRGDISPRGPVMSEGLSAGTRRVLKILVSAIFDHSAVMLLEQPEDSLHQGLTKKLIGLIQTNVDSQIIMSSHSSALLNKLEPENIRLVSIREGFTITRPLTEIEREAAVKFLNAEGPFYDFLEPLQ